MTIGIFNTSQLTTDLAKKSFPGMITRLMPNGNAPLFALTSYLESETAVQVEHGFFTKTMVFPSVVLSVAVANATDNIFTVVSTANILPNMILESDSTREQLIVDAVLSDTSIRVTRGAGVVAAAAINNSVALFQVGNASEESSLRPNALVINPVRVTNLTQIIRNTWAVSGTMRATMVIAGDTNVAESKQDCAAFHAADIEKALFFGQKSQGTRNGQPFRKMDGIISLVSQLSPSQLTVAGATTTFAQFEAAVDPGFNQVTDPKAGNERILFVGGTARKVINNMGKLSGVVQIMDGQTSFGMQFSSFKTARGTFRMIEHPIFNSNTSWAKMAVSVDLSSFRVAYLGDRKTQNEEFNGPATGDASENGIDAVGGTLTTELTAVLKNPSANAVITNLTAAA